MKKLRYNTFLVLIFCGIFCISCTNETTLSIEPEEAFAESNKITYEKDIKKIFTKNCGPCHLAGGSQPYKWDEYTTAKNRINIIILAVQLNPGDPGFVDRIGATKPSPEEIANLKQWLADGLLEK
jgi:mono/diheme cytochrome c family protein